jgi:hypothetical protein
MQYVSMKKRREGGKEGEREGERERENSRVVEAC